MDDDKHPGKYSLVLPPITSATTCHDNLVSSVLDYVTVLISSLGCVHLLHHAYWDNPMLVYRDWSNNIWIILGAGDPPVATFYHLTLAMLIKANTTSWKAMHDVLDATPSFKAPVVETDPAALSLMLNAMVPLSPSLAFVQYQLR
jgi:hypothetical protein